MTQTNAPVPQPRAAGSSPPPAVIPLKNPADPAKLPPVAPGAVPVGPEEHFQHVPTFWQKKWVVVGMPIATSVIFHAGLFIIMVILAVIFSKSVLIQPTKDQTVIPDSNFADQTPPGGVQFTGLHNDPLHQAFQDKVQQSTVKGWADKAGPAVNPTDAAGGGSGDTQDNLIAVGASGGFGVGKHGGGGGTGESSGTGSGEGGPLAMFGHPGGGGLGPHGLVFGNGGNALTIAFVCDASGSMMEKMEALKRELSKAVEGLHPFQKFSITFFQNQSCTYVDQSLLLATPENKRKAEAFLDNVSTSGTTNPIPGLDLAFRQHPQLVYLLTDGDFPNNDAVKAEIQKLNPGNKVKINTIAFTDSADTDTDFKKLLGEIAKESGGTFKAVNEEDLN